MSGAPDSDDIPTAQQPKSDELGPLEAVLLAMWPDGHGQAFPLPSTGKAEIGRGSSCAVRIQEPGVSRAHVLLHLGSHPAIEDLGSSNGTRFRGERLAAHTPQPLSFGDSFMIGGILLTLQRRPPHSRRASSEAAPILSEAMASVRALAGRVARGTISVLILGETGVGKEVMAQYLHMRSPRSSRPFLRLNCAALSEALIESELFGHEKGAFTGASAAKPGLLETADGGTVFLDEVGELSLATQGKLLRVLEQREFFRVGSVRARKVDVRFLAATNRDLEAEVARGGFRRDLFFRLAGTVLRIPPLRDRIPEIVPFAKRFLSEAAAEMAITEPRISAEALAWVEQHAWPGNLRELRNAMERAALLCGDGPVLVDHLTDSAAPPQPTDERQRITQALAQFAGNQTQAARFLGISRNTLIARIERYGLGRPRRP
jgi:two-component system, NtrC family, response regulator AtoC